MDSIKTYKSSRGTYVEVYDGVNAFDLIFHKSDLNKIIKIFEKLKAGEFNPPCNGDESQTAYNLGRRVLCSLDPSLKTNRLDGNWVEKSRVEVIYKTLIELKDKELISDLRSLKALYRKDKKDLKEKLSVASIATLNNIADKLKKRRENAQGNC